jgi:membrane associated rhomboid family serine protease
VSFILLLAVFVVVGYRLTSPEERARYLGIAMGVVRRMKVAAVEPGPEYESFRDALLARTRRALVTPALVAINVIVVGGMLFGAHAISDSNTLVAWGASLGTRTTNGEWWRLVTSTFVHTGTLHLLVDVAVLIQLGAVLERLAGRLALTGVYLSAGAFATLVSLSSHPVAVTEGASGAIFGLYGLLFATLIWQLLQRRREDPAPDPDQSAESSRDTRLTIPLIAMKRLGAGAAVFLVYSALSGLAHAAELGGLVVGLAYGLVLARRVSEMPLRNIADVTPEIIGVLATEERTVAAYRSAYDAFKRQRTSAEAVAQLAERIIVPELQATDVRLKALVNIPPEHQALVADAREYLRLRCASWSARADAIRKANADPREARGATATASRRLHGEARFRSNLTAMGKAESTERASLEVFQRIRRPARSPPE